MAPIHISASNELDELVSGFDRDPSGSRVLFDRRIEIDPEKFYTDAIEILKAGVESRGSNYLIGLILAKGLLLRAVCDPDLDRKDAIRIMHAAMHIDPGIDVRLLRTLADSLDSGSAALQGVGRLLDILGDLAPVNRMVPSLARLFRHPDPYIRSKAVLMVGRANRSARWTVQRLNDPDTRIRASAVQGLWGVKGDDVRDVMRTALADPNNRVAGNALLGLYQLGDVSTVMEIQAMAANSSMLFRATAAWVMGETKSVRFQECLAGLLRDSSPMVRKRAFAALRKIKDASTEPPAADWQVAARVSAEESLRGTRRVLLAVTPDGRQQPTVLGTQMLLTENGRPIHSYKVAERVIPDSLPVVFLFPRTAEQGDSIWLQGAMRCLRSKRTTDFWACEGFLTDGPCDAMPSANGPAFHSALAGAEAALRVHPQRTDCADVWHSMWRVLLGESTGVRGRRHVILFNPSKSPEVPALELAPVFLSRGSLQVVSMVDDPALEVLCSKVNGTFEVAASEDQVPDLIWAAYLRLLGRYELTYSPSNTTAEVRVKVQHPLGGGEVRVLLPPVSTAS